jgi:hypothetical protein
MKTKKKSPISEDERWDEYNKLKKDGKVFEANKLKTKILDTDKWKKPCHHVAGEIRK